jgi:predicted phosphate transport protein (TIGR00153 family)
MRFIPKEEKFFDHFEDLAIKIEEGGKLFLEILNNFEHSEAKVSTLKDIEHEADTITHRIYEKMHKTFLTPFDREDIYALANKMDSILDMIEASAVRMYLYKVKTPAPEIDEIKELALILNNAIARVKKIVHGLRDKKNSKMILEACVEINTLENEGDYILRQAMARLFERETDAKELVKWKEIFERIEEAVDVCEDVSNIAEGIVLKHG